MNLIMVMIDTLRYDYLGCNGNTWIDRKSTRLNSSH
jgi:arylsulfatase A-like enzyme